MTIPFPHLTYLLQRIVYSRSQTSFSLRTITTGRATASFQYLCGYSRGHGRLPRRRFRQTNVAVGSDVYLKVL